MCRAQASGGILIGEDGLIVTAGTISTEWYQTHQTHGFHVFNTIPSTPLLWAVLPSAASCCITLRLKCHWSCLTRLRHSKSNDKYITAKLRCEINKNRDSIYRTGKVTLYIYLSHTRLWAAMQTSFDFLLFKKLSQKKTTICVIFCHDAVEFFRSLSPLSFSPSRGAIPPYAPGVGLKNTPIQPNYNGFS